MKSGAELYLRNKCAICTICFIASLTVRGKSFAQEHPALLPLPQKIEITDNRFILNYKINIQHDSAINGVLLSQVKEILHSRNIDFSDNGNIIKQNIILKLVNQLPGIKLNKNQGYSLSVDANVITINAINQEGLFNAVQTLRQLVCNEKEDNFIQGCRITDWPAFRIRGFMHDTGRSFISIQELKNEIVLLSKYKINTFHWHLTEDLAWRLESKVCPMLTDTSVTLRSKGQYYTREQVIDFVAFCKKYFVTVIPEIDMPGHSASFTRATGFTMQSPEGKEIVKNVLSEACELFDTPYFHIGSDEVKVIDASFVDDMANIVRQGGKKVVVWMPGSEPGPNSVRQMWTGRSKSVNGTTVIDSRFLYLNHNDPFADLAATYNSNLCDAPEGSNDLAGAIACVWNDRRLNSEKDIILCNAFYPFMLALAERSWLGGGVSITKNGVRLGLPGDSLFDKFRDFEERMLINKKLYFSGLPFPYVKQTNIFWRVTQSFPNSGKLDAVFPPENNISEEYIYNGQTIQTFPVAGATVYLRHTWGETVPAAISLPLINSTVYAFTYVYSPVSQNVGFWAGFHNFGRSEADATPPVGKWDYKESRIWLNDRIVNPPVWKYPGHVSSDKEIPYADESFEMRTPLIVTLEKGWNKVLLKMPVGDFTSRYTRLVKWMFTAVFVTPDGKDACEELIYSPEKKFK